MANELRIREVTPAEEWAAHLPFDITYPPQACCVYAIFQGKKCLYVGSTVRLRNRIIHGHQVQDGRLAYKDVPGEMQGFYLPCAPKQLGHLETQVIRHLRPTMNCQRVSRRVR